MPRSGGESGKLGDRYEAVWTVDSLLDVLSGEAENIEVEPFDPEDSLGIEFKKNFNRLTEFHSAKRQTTGQLWSLAELTAVGKNGRSILDDLIGKLNSVTTQVVFVSGTTARDLEELWQAATTSHDLSSFRQRIAAMPAALQQNFEDRLLRPRFNNDMALAFDCLGRIRVVGFTESEMIRRVDQRIRGMLYRIDGIAIDAHAIRLLLTDLVLNWLGEPIRKSDIAAFLSKHGVAESDWGRSSGPRETVERRNTVYVNDVEAELIDGERIPRSEAEQAFRSLQGDKKSVVFIGAAGLGKSCTVVQALEHLKKTSIPYLVVRLDLPASALTSRGLGQGLGLPESPVLVLAGLAKGARCVLVLDQVDAISFFSGRNQALWEVFEELLLEASRYPQMRILVACRAVDAEHDPRLRRLLAESENVERIELGLLSIETVKVSVEKAGVKSEALDATHIELLRTPLHLSLYLQGDPRQHPKFRGVQELLGRYWSHKRRLVAKQLNRESRWHDIVKRLVERLSHNQTLSAPRMTLDAFDEADVGAMASQNVLVLDGATVRFFHETFFDYCCARLFAEEKRTLLEFLVGDGLEQHLFRRAQVRQILEFQREHNFPEYLRDLKDILTDGKIRYHLKKLAVDWLNRRLDPRPEEWQVLESIAPADPISSLANRIAWQSPSWVDLLDKLGVWERWLDAEDVQMVRQAVWLLGLPDVVYNCATQIARLFRPYVEGKKAWKEEFQGIFSFKEAFLSRAMFELLRDATRAKLLRTPTDQDWYHYEEFASARPEWAVELLGVILDARNDEADEEEESDKLSIEFVAKAARGAPKDFANEVFPRVITEVKTWDANDPYNRWGARRMLQRGLGRTYDEMSALELGLEIALEHLAQNHPDSLDAVLQSAELRTDNILAALLLKAWSANGRHYGDKIVTYLLGNLERLTLGYFSWGSGNGTGAIARGAVKAASEYCSSDTYSKLEAAILSLVTDRERQEPKGLGYHRMLLLERLPPTRMSRKAKLHFEELKRKFPGASFEMPVSGPQSGFVGPPIPQEATKHMNDSEWLRAMRSYTDGKSRDTHRDFLKGGKYELATLLRSEAQKSKARFAQLTLKMEDTIAPDYYGAIISGITSTQTEATDSPDVQALKQQQLAAHEIVPAIERAHRVAGEELARDICWAIKAIASPRLHEGMISIVADYAVRHPDPEKEQWREPAGNGQYMWGGDPHFHGMNSVRGAASEALGALLFADKEVFPKVEKAVLSVVHDRSTAVRSCAVLCLVAMINFDHDKAVELFLELCSGAEEMLDTHYVEQFIHYSTFRHYSLLRKTLLTMLKSEKDGQVSIAARQIAIAAFYKSEAREDVELVLSGSIICRKEAAGIYAHNLGRPQYRDTCADRLCNFFRDSEPDVRGAASNCFRRLSSNQLSEEVELIFAFIESPACIENSHQLVHALEESKEPLPEVICRIPERLIQEHRSAGTGKHFESRRWLYHLPALVARLYEQSRDEDIKRRCLNIIDGMLELDVGDIEKELAQVER